MTPREVIDRLLADGFVEIKGKGDHRNFRKDGIGRVTVDPGVREIPIGTLRSIFRQARWIW
jgi:predicted RNA binding protein YcfA (HicA-like mRNA interferase family)